MASSVHNPPTTTTTAPVAPPTPQEIQRKLSVHNKPIKSPPPRAHQPVSGTESDSDSFLSPDHSPLPGGNFTGLTYGHYHPHQHGQSSGMGQSATHGITLATSTSTKPLSSIAERRTGSGDEESDEEEDGDGDEWAQEQEQPQGLKKKRPAGDSVVKAGYLLKKGERRKTWKKRWFVLRPAQLAFYKSSAEYQLLRLVDVSDIHSCSPVNLKKHANSFVLVSPTRTFYLEAQSERDMQDWVERVNETREALMSTSTQNSMSTPSIPIPIPASSSGSRYPNISQSPTSYPGGTAITPSPPSSRGIGHNGPLTSESDSEDAAMGTNATGAASATSPVKANSPSSTKDPTKTILSGYLMKSRKRRGWRKRWFVLTGEKLMYSASHMDTKRQRCIELAQIIDALEYDLSHDRQHSGASSLPSPPSALGLASSAPRHGYTGYADEHAYAHHDGDSMAPGSGSGIGIGIGIGIGTGNGTNTTSNGATYAFKVVTTKRTLILSAPSEEEEIKWLSAVRALIARRANPPGAGGATGTGTATGHAGTSPSAMATGASMDPGGLKTSSSIVSRRRSASGTSTSVAVGRDER